MCFQISNEVVVWQGQGQKGLEQSLQPGTGFKQLVTPGISSPCSVGQNIPEGFASNLGINTPLSLDTKDLIVICWVLSLESRTSFHLLHVKPHYQVRDENILSVPRVMRFYGTLTIFLGQLILL